MERRTIGAWAEAYTAQKLQEKGYTILERNYHSRFGEVDIIAQKGAYLVFVEVKARTVGAKVSPLEAVSRSKQRRLRLTVQQYLQQHPHLSHLQPRIDVAALLLEENGAILEQTYLPNAFGGESHETI